MQAPLTKGQPTRRIGRYALFGEIAAGGMATVYFGRQTGAVGFSRSVAIKQLHPQFARSPEFVAQFLDEAQLTARIRHPNVVSVLDVVARDGELFVIMEFVEGEPLSRLVRFAVEPSPIPVASAILIQALLGLHAAHEATTETGEPLQIVHRDVSPQNILVGVDGATHVLDFGVAKAASRVNTTENGEIKGKIAYMAPEQLNNGELDRRVDVFAAGIVLWELLTGQRLFARGDPGAVVGAVLQGGVKPPSELRPGVSAELDAIVLKALASDREERFATAREMAVALENCAPPASSLTVGAWVEKVAGDSLRERAQRLREVEESSSVNAIIDKEALQRRLANLPASAPPSRRERDRPSDRTLTEAATVRPGLAKSMWVERGARPRWLVRTATVAFGVLAFIATVLALRGSKSVERSNATFVPSAAVAPPSAPPAALGLAEGAASAPKAIESSPHAASALPSSLNSPKFPQLVKKATAKDNAPPPRADCVPPYVLDAQGRKRFKAECF